MDVSRALRRFRSGGAESAPAVGDAAPPLEGATLHGGRFRLADWDRPMLVTFLRHAG